MQNYLDLTGKTALITGASSGIGAAAGDGVGGSGRDGLRDGEGRADYVHEGVGEGEAPHGVWVNAVSPGVIDTPFHEVFSTPETIAFLASEAAGYIVGGTLEVNGGQLML